MVFLTHVLLGCSQRVERVIASLAVKFRRTVIELSLVIKLIAINRTWLCISSTPNALLQCSAADMRAN